MFLKLFYTNLVYFGAKTKMWTRGGFVGWNVDMRRFGGLERGHDAVWWVGICLCAIIDALNANNENF